jgi:hypothetical protein
MSTAQTIGWAHWQRRAQAVGLVGLVVCAGLAFLHPRPFFRSYLVAFNFWLGIALGCLVIVMLYHLTGGGWGFVIRRLLESASRTLPLLVLSFVPLIFGLHDLYAWSNPGEDGHSALAGNKGLYLQVPFFLGRAAFYFVVWLVVAFLINRWSREQDRTADPDLPRRFRLLSGPGLVLYGFTITFAAVDWVMSLQTDWFSTIFPVVFAVGQILTAFAFVIAVLALLADRPPFSGLVSAELLQDLGNLLLAFVMVWAYVSFAQFLLIWSGNLPEEIAWYVPRIQGGWQWLGWTLVTCQFALPFLLLLFRDVKRQPRTLAAVAGLVLALRFVDLVWQIVPSFAPPGLLGHWLDILIALVALVGLGGIWMAVFLWQLNRAPLVPPHDPALAEGSHHA